MTEFFPCSYLGAAIEFTDERARHITAAHPDLLPEFHDAIPLTLADPDLVRRSARFGDARLFSRWHTDIRGGKHAVVVVVSDEGSRGRHWIITAYLASKLVEGDAEWKRG